MQGLLKMKTLKLISICVACFMMSGCFAGLLGAIQDNGYLDGIPNMRNKDVEDVAGYAKSLNIDPASISLADPLTDAQRAKYAVPEVVPVSPVQPAPVINIIIDPELIRRLQLTE